MSEVTVAIGMLEGEGDDEAGEAEEGGRKAAVAAEISGESGMEPDERCWGSGGCDDDGGGNIGKFRSGAGCIPAPRPNGGDGERST